MKMSLGRLSWQRHKKCRTKHGAESLFPPQREPVGSGRRYELVLWGPQRVPASARGTALGGSGAGAPGV